MVKLVGTNANQVPTNGMLGNMAFQNKEGVSIDLLGLAAGSAAAPSLIPTGDPNTGVFFPAADTFALATNGTERFRISSVGAWGLSGANYGSANQVLTSAGSSSPPTWSAVNPVGGGTDRIIYENDATATTNYTITAGKNAGTFGPLTINSGVTITVPSGSVWTIV